ncbi:MAG: TonB-dependent receptor [Opitutae bacterium]|nr:TonB-dependent receptor [Opitutae bacterium]
MKTAHRLAVFASALLGFAHAGSSQPAAAPKNDEVVSLAAFTVTGTNLKRLEQEKSLPVTRLDTEQIDLSGALSVSDFLRTLAPIESSVGNIGATATGPNDAGGDAASVNLRGLGDGNTLVLLNGRRLSTYGIAPNTPPVAFVNINQIPTGAVERLEILRDGASAIYGSDATGGVVNIILKKNYEGVDLRTRYGAASGGYDELTASVATGRVFNAGRTTLNLIATYYERDGLDASDRVYAADPDKRSLVGAPFNANSAFNGRSSSGPYGRFSRVNTYNADGTVSSSTSFFMQPAASGTGVDLVSGTGPASSYNSQIGKQLIADVRRYNLHANLSHRLAPRIELIAEGSFYYARSHNQSGATPLSGNTTLTGTDNVIVPASNYYNPYGQRLNPAAPRDVLIRNYRTEELGPRIFDVDIDSYRLLAALQGRLGETWTWETGALFMESLTKDYQGNLISQSRLNAQLALNTPEAFNVFGGPNVNPRAVLDKVRITDWTRGTGELALFDAKISGDLFPCWGGPVAMAAGIEHREEKLKERNGPFGLADDIIAISGQIDVTAQRDVQAGYAEVSVPVIGKNNRFDFVQAFDLTVAGRYEDFGGFSATKPKFSVALTTLPWLLLRASSGEGFRAPSISQLFQPARGRRNAGFIDTARQYTVGSTTITPEDATSGVSKLLITGGNPRLQPENSRSWNIGTVIEPPALKGFSVGVDYWGIKQDGRIDSPTAADELAKDARLWRASRGANPNVVRAPQTQSDRDNNIPGVLISINGTYQNLARREVQGFDLFADYAWRTSAWGRFQVRADASRYLKFRDTDTNGVVTELIRQSGRPRWRSNASLLWRQSAWSAGLLARYVGDYESDPSLDTAGAPFIVRSWTTFNAYVGYQCTRGWLRGTTVRVGANNVFDRDPPLSPGVSDGYDSGNANAIGRLVYVELRRKF